MTGCWVVPFNSTSIAFLTSTSFRAENGYTCKITELNNILTDS